MSTKRTISQRSELIYDIHTFGINVDTRELFLNSDYHTENDEVDYRMAVTLIKNIRFLDSQSSDPIIIHMCSCGGSWEYGLAIYDVIKSSPSLVYIVAYAQASSMASIFLQAGDVRILTPNTYVMIHEGENGWDGTHTGLLTYAEQAKRNSENMLDIYVENCKNGPYFKDKQMDDLQIRNFIKKHVQKCQEWYLPAEEAIEYGFADYIWGDTNCPLLKDVINLV